MTKGGKRGFLGVVAHFVTLPLLAGAHSSERMFSINLLNVSYFILNNAKIGFNAPYHHLHSNAFNNDASKLAKESNFITKWRRDGPLGVLLDYALFTNFQRLSHRDLPASAIAEDYKILKPVKPIITRWNSYYSCFKRAVKLQPAITAYANYHIKRGHFSVITKIILVFKHILIYYEQRVKAYKAVNYNAHNKVKANAYYAKLDYSLAYYTATILYPYYKTYCDVA
ncbi:hypothetical protein CC80DRAFT_519956 [Byssothecium circinans]|uniref:Uncharacterized protein n=1 Tax=Byssothecium circinans TaxID=147558 RepID=A0A6A5TID3_9PLEO|nr:hypothetical protein CC80DRAFT_519956 [Byssothecium circinans]